ncbi:MAG: 3-hydroxyacyl-CoA dehydrogenase family protein, partial [Verrucomicrobiota bacterium]
LNFGMPMGPLRLSDEVGIDVAHHVASFLTTHYKDRMPEPGILNRMLEEGLLGRKSGAGFYAYQGKKSTINPTTAHWTVSSEAHRLSSDDLLSRMVLLMINEAARCLEEGVADDPADIDFAMIMGTGFAPFRGGPLRYADSVGMDKLLKLFDRMTEQAGSRYEPCPLIETMAKNDESFYNQ